MHTLALELMAVIVMLLLAIVTHDDGTCLPLPVVVLEHARKTLVCLALPSYSFLESLLLLLSSHDMDLIVHCRLAWRASRW